MSRKPTPAKRLHALAARHGLSIAEYSPGLRIWSIYRAGKTQSGESLAFGIPHSQVHEAILKIHASLPGHEKMKIEKTNSQMV